MSHWVDIGLGPGDPWDPDEFQAEAMEAAQSWIGWFNQQHECPTPEEALPLLEEVIRPICERLVPDYARFELKMHVTLWDGTEWWILMDNNGSCRIA